MSRISLLPLLGVLGCTATQDPVVPYEPLRLVTMSWGVPELRITDDVLGIADGDAATPRIVAGSTTGLTTTSGGVAIDAQRDLIYVANETDIRVFAGLATLDGDVAPERVITIDGDTGLDKGLLVDPATDRLYVSGTYELYVIPSASTADGAVDPLVLVAPDANADMVPDPPGPLALDAQRDLLYVGSDYEGTVTVYEGASTLADGHGPARAMTWQIDVTGFDGPASLAVDPANDRLMLGSNWPSPANNHLVVLENASTASGMLDLDVDSVAQHTRPAIATFLDGGDRLWVLEDSATSVRVYGNVSDWLGQVDPPAHTIRDVVASGYGIAVTPM